MTKPGFERIKKKIEQVLKEREALADFALFFEDESGVLTLGAVIVHPLPCFPPNQELLKDLREIVAVLDRSPELLFISDVMDETKKGFEKGWMKALLHSWTKEGEQLHVCAVEGVGLSLKTSWSTENPAEFALKHPSFYDPFLLLRRKKVACN